MFLVNAPSPRQSTPPNNQRRISGLWKRISNRFSLQGNSIEPFRAQRRNLLIDALRGICFVMMTVDHLPGNVLDRFSNTDYGPFGFFTGALGFVFLSGLVSGSVYENCRRLHGSKAMIFRILRRIRVIYLAQMFLFFSFFSAVALHVYSSSNTSLDFFRNHPWKAVLFGATLLHEPTFVDILPMYCFFLALTPLVLWQFRAGHFWRVMSASITLWLLPGFAIHLPIDPNGIDFGTFNPLSLQMIFIAGLAVGTGNIAFDRQRPATRKLMMAAAVVISIVLFLLRWGYVLNPAVAAAINPLHHWSSRRNLGPIRLLNFTAFGLTVHWLTKSTDWSRCYNRVFRWLTSLGQHALPVFVWSILTRYLALALLPHHSSAVLRSVATVLAVMSLALPPLLIGIYRRQQKEPRFGFIALDKASNKPNNEHVFQ
jgi:hypothetical protein